MNNNNQLYGNDLHVLIRKNSLYMLLERTVGPLINILVTAYIIRKLSVDEYGIYNILLAVMAYVGLISSLGLPSIFQRFIPEFYQKKQLGKLKKLVEQSLLWRFLIISGIILIILLFSGRLGELFKFGDAFQYLIMFSIAIIFSLESRLLGLTLTSVFHHKMYAAAQIGYLIFRACVLYYLIAKGMGLIGLLIGESIAFVFLFFIQAFYYRKFLGRHSIENNAVLPYKRMARFGGFSYFNEVGAQILSVSTDFLVISAFLGPAAVGLYAFANKMITLIIRFMPISILINLIRPTFFTKYVQNDDNMQINKMFNFLVKLIAFFGFPLVIGIILLSDKLIIYIFDPKYLESLKIVWIMAAFMTLNFFMVPIGLVLQSKEKVQILFFSKIFAIYNLIGDFLVVKPYGIVGIALVTGSAVLFKNLFCYFYAKKYTALSTNFRGLGKITFNSLLMGLLLYPMRTIIVNILSLILMAMVGGIIYFLISYFNRAFSQEERIFMNKVLPRPIFAF